MKQAKFRISKETPNLPSVEFTSDLERVSMFVLDIQNVYLDLPIGEGVFLESGAKLVRKDENTFRMYGFEERSVQSIDGIHIFEDLNKSLQKMLEHDVCDEWGYIDA